MSKSSVLQFKIFSANRVLGLGSGRVATVAEELAASWLVPGLDGSPRSGAAGPQGHALLPAERRGQRAAWEPAAEPSGAGVTTLDAAPCASRPRPRVREPLAWAAHRVRRRGPSCPTQAATRGPTPCRPAAASHAHAGRSVPSSGGSRQAPSSLSLSVNWRLRNGREKWDWG
jgi:hypothetical protein